MVGDAGHAIFSRPAPSAQPPQVTARPGMFGPVQRNQFVAAPPKQITAGPLAAPVVKAPLVNTKTFQPASVNPVVKALVSGEKTLATGVARVLPGGTNDLKAQQNAAQQNQMNLIRAHSLMTAGKITPVQFAKLANVNASQANATSADVNSTIKAMPSKKGLALAAGETLLDATSGGSLQGAKAAYRAAKVLSVTKDATPAVKAAAKQAFKEAVTKPVVTKKVAEEAPRLSYKAKDFIPDMQAGTRKLGFKDKAARSTTGQMEILHKGSGQMIDEARNIGEKSAAGDKWAARSFDKLTTEEQTNAALALHGEARPMNAAVGQAVRDTKQALKTIPFRAKGVGLKIAGIKKNYFPVFYHPDVFKVGSDLNREAVAHLVKTGQAKDSSIAQRMLDATKKIREVGPYEDPLKTGAREPKVFQNLTEHRSLDLPRHMQALNKEALHLYFERANAAIAHAKVFGPKGQKFETMRKIISANGGPEAANEFTQLYRVALGIERGNESARKAANVVNTINASTRMGTSALMNATQPNNTIVTQGIGNTVRAGAKVVAKKLGLNPRDEEYLAKTGVASQGVTHEQAFGQTGVADKTLFKLAGHDVNLQSIFSPFFQSVEKFNREQAAIAGRDRALTLARKASGGDARAASVLKEKYGVTVAKGGKLSPADQIEAGRASVATTQFRTAAQDLPPWASTAWGRVVTQFKRYPYKQSQFLWNEVLQPAAHGDLMPLLRQMTIAAPAALAANQAVDKIRGNNFNNSIPKEVISAISNAMGGELVTGTAGQLYPSQKDAGTFTENVVKTLGGPTARNGVDNTKAAFNTGDYLLHGNKTAGMNAARQGIKQVPLVSAFSNRIIPYPDKQGGTPGKTVAGTDKFDPKQAFNTPEGKAFMKLSDADKKIAAASDPAARDLYDQYQAVKKGNGAKKLYSLDLSNESHKTLDRMDHLTTAGRAKVLDREKDAEYKIAVAQYEDNTLNGRLTPTQDIEAQDALAKKFVGSHYDKNTRDIYKLAQKDLKRYIAEHPDQADALLAYDQELYDNGLIASLKFKDGIGGSGGGGKKSVGSPYKYVAKKQGGEKLGGVAYKDTSHKFVVSRSKTASSKPKVSIKKSRV